MSKTFKLMNKNFFLLWQGQFVSVLGNQAYMVAMMYWLLARTESATIMGLLMMFSALAGSFFGTIGGTFADNHSRYKIIIVCDMLSGLSVFTLGFIMLSPLKHQSDLLIILIFTVNILLGIIRSFFSPAISASIPDIVPKEKVFKANSLFSSSGQVSKLIGQGFGGVLFNLLGAPLLFIIDGISFFFSAFSTTFISIPQKLKPNSANAAGFKNSFNYFKLSFIDGLKVVWIDRGLRNIIIFMTFVNLFFMPIVVLLPFYVSKTLLCDAKWYGFLMAMDGFGLLIGSLSAGLIKVNNENRGFSLIVSLLLASLMVSLLGFFPINYLALLFMFLQGLFLGYYNVNAESILQLKIDSELRGRVYGFLITLSMGTMPIAMGLSGIIADLLHHNISFIYSISGIMLVILSLIPFFDRDMKAFLTYDHTKQS